MKFRGVFRTGMLDWMDMKRMGLWLTLMLCVAISAFAQSPTADLTVSLDGVGYGTAGTQTQYYVTVTNNGPAPATSVVLSDPVPAGLTYISAQYSDGPAFSCSGTSTVTCTTALMANGATADFTLTFNIKSNVANNSTINNSVTVSSAVTDPNLTNNSSGSPLYVYTLTSFAPTKTAAATVNAGSNLTYTITVSDTGPSDAQTVSLSDPLPAGTTFVSNTQTSGPAFSCTNPAVGANGTVTCTIATLAANATAVFSLTVNVPSATVSGTVLSNTATVTTTTSTGEESGPAAATANTTVATSADLSITKTGPSATLAGQNIVYTVTVTNNGPSQATALTIADTTPPGLTFVSNTGACTTAYPCFARTLGSGQSLTITSTYSIPPGATGSISNTATVSATTADPNSANNSSTATTAIAPPMSCQVTTTAVPARAESSTELVADVIFTCTGGVPTAAGSALPTDTVVLTFSSNVTSRLLNSANNNASEALALVDAPQPGAQFPCDPYGGCLNYGNGLGTGYYGGGTSTPGSPANRNVYQGTVAAPIYFQEEEAPSAGNPKSITWYGVPVDASGSGTRTYRFTNLRLDATGGLAALQLTGISTSILPVALGNSPLPVATPQTSLTAGVRDSADAVSEPGGTNLAVAPLGLPVTRFATLRFAGAFPAADKPRTATFVNADTSPTPVNQNIPGKNYGSESGFYNSSFATYGESGNLGTAGLADFGTRYMAVFSNIPAGFTLYVDLHSATTANGNVARLVTTDGNGAGAFSAVAGAGNMAQLTASGGSAVAVWEVLQNDTAAADQFDFGVYISSVAGIVAPPPSLTVQMRYAPFSPATSIPLFSGTANTQTLLTFLPAPQLVVSPSSLTFSGTAGGQSPAPQNLLLTSNSASAQVLFSVGGGNLSYQISPSAGNTPASVSVAPGTNGLTAGTYQDAVTISGNGGSTGARVAVTLILTPGPRITSLSPSSASAGGPAFTLTVNGTNFVSNMAIQWNGTALPTSFISAAQVTAAVPASLITRPGTASITALTSDQALSNSVAFPITAPQLTAINPSTVVAGSAGFALTLSGSGFLPGATVSVGASTLQPSAVAAGQITVPVPASLVAQPASLAVAVSNPGGVVSNSLALTVTLLQLTSISPSAVTATGPAFTLTLNGAGFAAGAVVNVGGTTLQPSALSAGQITVSVPAAVIAKPATLAVTVANPGNLVSNSLPLTVTAGPALTALTPSSATAGHAALTVALVGTGFVAGDTANWNGQSLTTSVQSATQLNAQVSAALLANAGTAQVNVTTVDGAASNSLPFTINPAPTITALSPASATPGTAAFTLTVSGANFFTGATILWNGQSVPTSLVSSSQLTGQVAAGLIATSGAVSVTVISSDGISSNALPFTLKLPPLTGVGITAPSGSTSGQNQPVTVNITSIYPVDLLGTLTLTFAGQGGLPDDPSIQFQNGSRVFTFTVPAGTQPSPLQVMVSTGTVAGTITITPTFTAGGTDVTPAGIAPEIILIAPAAPSLSTPTCAANASGFTVTVDGYSNTRDATVATFNFQAASGATLGTAQLAVTVGPLFAGWFGSTASAANGGEFAYTQPFTVQGALSTIASVTVTLGNSSGTSTSVSCQVP